MAPDPLSAPSLADEQRDSARSRILRAAQAVLASRGLAATVDDVADAAGVSRRTVFRHFPTRDGLFAAAIREGMRRYTQRITLPPQNDDLRAWLLDLLLVTHQLNARNGRIYWELALEPDAFSGELARVAAERRASRRQFAAGVTARMWQARGGHGEAPPWLGDAVAVHLSGFTTQSLTGDFGRTPEEVARLSAQVLEAALAAARPAGRALAAGRDGRLAPMTGPAGPGQAGPGATGPGATRTLSEADFAVGIEDRYFEDYQAGAVYEYGYVSVTEAEIVAFARQFDPQPIHVDPSFAAAGPFGGLIASGWHTAGLAMRLIADHYLSRVASLASPGIDELRWATPVRPGDTLRLRMTIVEARVSRSKPDRGLIRTRGELLNQDDGTALSLLAMNLILRREGR